jgi:antitoxin component of MazEF toxin-antitoxin module
MFELARRRLQRISGCLMVSIPKAWIRDRKLSKGDYVSIRINSRRELVIVPAKEG